MSERYRRLFSLQENLYVSGAPVVISAGSLLLDTKSNGVLAQLKFTSIAPAKIKALTVRIQPADTAGKPLGEELEFQYMDLNADRDIAFGDRVPIQLPDKGTRAFTAYVGEVVFDNNTIWQCNNKSWSSIPSSKTIREHTADKELQKQYQIEMGDQAYYIFSQHLDVWYCSCGALNRQGEEFCHCCKRAETVSASVDWDKLREKCDLRVAKEQADAHEMRVRRDAEAKVQAEKNRKFFKTVGVVLGAAAIVIAICVLVTQIVLPTTKYNKALNLLENGQYEESIALFTELSDYKDSAVRISEAELAIQERANEEAYTAAAALEQKGEIGAAAVAFGKLGGYKDSVAQSMRLFSEITEYHTIAVEKIAACINENGNVSASSNWTKLAEYTGTLETCNTWRNIVSLAVGEYHIAGLSDNGRVYAAYADERFKYNSCNVEQWENIVDIQAEGSATYGLKCDGTILSTSDFFTQALEWKDIVMFSVSEAHIVAMDANGKIYHEPVEKGTYSYSKCKCDMSAWTDVVDLATDRQKVLGLKSDGTILCVGATEYGLLATCNDAVDVESFHALKSDGTIIVGNSNYAHDLSKFKNIVDIFISSNGVAGLRENGTAIAVGQKGYYLAETIESWTNIRVPK